MRQGKAGLGAALACAAIVGFVGVSAAGAAGSARIEVLSNRADLISGGDALVAVDFPSGADPSKVKVLLGTRDVTPEFALRPNGRYEGLVTGLALGSNTLSAAGAKATIVNHPIGGPVIAGPQVKPWVCQNGSADPQCNAPTSFSYEYKSSVTGLIGDLRPVEPAAGRGDHHHRPGRDGAVHRPHRDRLPGPRPVPDRHAVPARQGLGRVGPAAAVEPQAADHPRRELRCRPPVRHGAQRHRRHRGPGRQPDHRARPGLRRDVHGARQRRAQLQPRSPRRSR